MIRTFEHSNVCIQRKMRSILRFTRAYLAFPVLQGVDVLGALLRAAPHGLPRHRRRRPLLRRLPPGR